MTQEEIDKLERLIGQVSGIHAELSALSKKSPNDAVNKFKLGLINAVIHDTNTFLGSDRPAGGFSHFEPDDVPSNSDVTFVVSLYMEALEKIRSDNIEEGILGKWHYRGKAGAGIRTAPPSKLQRKV